MKTARTSSCVRLHGTFESSSLSLSVTLVRARAHARPFTRARAGARTRARTRARPFTLTRPHVRPHPNPRYAAATLNNTIVVLFVAKVAILDTGVANLHKCIVLDVPNTLKLVSITLGLSCLITLYLEANDNIDTSWSEWLYYSYSGLTLVSVLALSLGLPLKRIIEGDFAKVSGAASLLLRL